MKKQLILAVVALGIGAVSMAQGNQVESSVNKPHRPVTPKYEQMRKDLNLTPDQMMAIREIRLKYVAQESAARKDDSQNSTVVMRRLQKQQSEEIRAVLTPTQERKAAELRKRRNAQRLDAYDTPEEHPHK